MQCRSVGWARFEKNGVGSAIHKRVESDSIIRLPKTVQFAIIRFQLQFLKEIQYFLKRFNAFIDILNVSKGTLSLFALNELFLTNTKRNQAFKIKNEHLILIEL